MAPRHSETASQRARRLLGSGLDKTWPNVRHSRRPRGLRNPDVYCYRNAALQVLMHLPKFINWIMQHNERTDGVIDWPCHPDDPNRRLPEQQRKDKAVTSMKAEMINGCVPCRLKTLIRDYWGTSMVGSTPDQIPLAFPHDRPSVQPLHRLGERWNCQLPPPRRNEKAKDGETDAQFIARRLQRETAKQLKARVDRATGQSCADEFMGYIHEGIKYSIGPTNQTRLDQYAALFVVQRHEERRCASCNAARSDPAHIDYSVTRDIGFSNIQPSPEGPDDLMAALIRSDWLADEHNDALTCVADNCNHQGATLTRRIEAAPEYLRVHLDLSTKNHDKVTNIKNKNPIEIPDILDLTEHTYAPETSKQPWPLRYKLISVLYHVGDETTHGHWVAGVSCPRSKAEREARNGKRGATLAKAPPRYFFSNDHRVDEWQTIEDGNPLTENPYIKYSSKYNAVVLMYERLPKTKMQPNYVDDIATTLNEKFYEVGKKRGSQKESNGKKRKETDDSEERSLRRSKRLRERNQ